jgi:16S rRNA (cytidine1402-2'-O)-methyltransferase
VLIALAPQGGAVENRRGPDQGTARMSGTAWREEGGELPPALYVVATPLGNLADITLRALDTLRRARVVACEDTRHSRKLLEHYGIRAQLVAVHEHNEEAAAERLIGLLGAGTAVALITDAGTPAFSDPGARVVARVRAVGHAVVPVPGPSAAVAALSVSGIEATQVLFYGFLPSKPAARRAAIEAVGLLGCALLFYEAPHRIAAAVADLAQLLRGARTLVLARELTKLHEEIVRLPLAEAPAWLAADENRRRGEFVLIVSGASAAGEAGAEDAERVLRILLRELPLSRAVALACEITGGARNALYERALELSAQRDTP